MHTAIAAIKTGMVVYGSVINNRAVDISIVHYSCINVYYGSIIAEMVTFPAAANKTVAAVSIPIVNAAVKTDMRTPVTPMEAIITARVSPPGGCPKQAGLWWCSPIAGHPVIAIRIIIRPITGHPQVSINGACGLIING